MNETHSVKIGAQKVTKLNMIPIPAFIKFRLKALCTESQFTEANKPIWSTFRTCKYQE